MKVPRAKHSRRPDRRGVRPGQPADKAFVADPGRGGAAGRYNHERRKAADRRKFLGVRRARMTIFGTEAAWQTNTAGAVP